MCECEFDGHMSFFLNLVTFIICDSMALIIESCVLREQDGGNGAQSRRVTFDVLSNWDP